MWDIFCRQDDVYLIARLHDLRYYRRAERRGFTVKILLALAVAVLCITAMGACFYYFPKDWEYLFWVGSGVALFALIVMWVCFCLINKCINISTMRHMRMQATTVIDDPDEDLDLVIPPESEDVTHRIHRAFASCDYVVGVPVVDSKPIMHSSSLPIVTHASTWDVHEIRESNSYEEPSSLP